jgi:hypothetical protein
MSKVKERILKKLRKALNEWHEILDNQGENWEQFDRQEGEIDGLLFAIEVVERTKFNK